MNKIINTRALISILAVMVLVIGLIFLIRSCGMERTVRASVSSIDIVLGEAIVFNDSTSFAESWLWEFGNGDYSTDKTGTYRFPDEGRYQIRLRVNNRLEKTFIVRVRPRTDEGMYDHVIRINAPRSAVQGEYILFTAEGNDRDWRWEFGESGIIDSREKTAIYAYRNHGTYQVRLSTEQTQYPIFHLIEILPKYMEVDNTDPMTIAANDIKVRLQNIADGRPFNVNYNYILNTYLCNNPDVLVNINNRRRNDFYSYCQGLRMTGRGTTIETVFVEASNATSNCIDRIIILQFGAEDDRTFDLSR